MSNARLSGGAAVPLERRVGRDGVVNDGHEKNPASGVSVVFQTLHNINQLNVACLEQR